jgi:hypothetical protein
MLAKRSSMHKPCRISSVAISLAMTVAVCSAQSVTSAHSGTLHYFEGDVSIDGAQVQSKVGRFSEIKEQGVLRTAQGRAEVLLTPGVFLRVGENTSIKLLDNRLVSTRVELLSGTAMVESDDPQLSIKDSPVTMIYKDYQIQMLKHGVIEISSDPGILKVFKGEALVNTADLRATVKEGRQMPFSAALLTEKFDGKVGDDLYLWTRDRSQSLSAASMSSARSLNSNGFGSGLGSGFYGAGLGSGLGGWNGGWYYNQFFDMYTYVPMGGTFFNSFGYGFFSPATIYNYYTPTTYWYGGGGARGTGAIGQPLGTSGAPTRTALPINTLRAGNTGATGGMPALGNPVRGGGQVGALSNVASSPATSSAIGSSSVGGNRGGGGISAGGGGGGMSAGGGSAGGSSSAGRSSGGATRGR